MAKRKLSTFERLQKGKLNRNGRRELARRLNSADPGLTVVHPNSAGIDVGCRSHFVAVPPDRDREPIREFGSWTDDLRQTAQWLVELGIETVVMQATGVYWIALEKVLRQSGLKVSVVNATGTKNLPGRKTDVQECEWLRKLHTYGLLRGSFRVAEEIEQVQTIWRRRERVVKGAAESIQHMQKALTKMNVQLANAVSDIAGVTGMKIIRAMVGGQLDPWTLAKLRDGRIQASEEEIARSLEGHWREDLLWELKQALEAYEFHEKQRAACDEKLREYLRELPTREAEPVAGELAEESAKQAKKRRAKQNQRTKNQPQFDLRAELVRVTGTDLTSIEGVSVMTAQTIFSEVGADLSAFASERHFCSWLQLTPRRDVSGGKVIRHVKSRVQNRIALALRMGAESLWHSDSYLGAKYRHLRIRLGGLKATKAMARQLACLVYRMMTKGQAWVDRGAAYYEGKRRDREVAALQRKAAAFGMTLTAAA